MKHFFKIVFTNYENSPHLKSVLFSNKILSSWKKILEDVINGFNKKGYTFDRIDELNIIRIADKMDMS